MAESKSIYEKLAEMRVELQAKKLIKTGKNTYSKYEYYELSDFLPSCNSIAAQHKTLFKFAINENTASLTLINLENLEDVIEFSIPTASVSIQGATAMQNIGAVTTYARRYLYMIAMEISEDDNLDIADTAEKVTKEQQQRKEEAERKAQEAKEAEIKAMKISFHNRHSNGNDMKQQYQVIISNAIRLELKRTHINSPIRLKYMFYEPNRKRDLDNIAGVAHKFIQDALVKCKVIDNDGWNNIVGFEDHFFIDKHNPRIEVVLEEVKP